jgi:hypothetical protein
VNKNGFEAPSLKYVYYGYDADRRDGLTPPVYDKASYHTLYRIVTEGHDMDIVRDYMDNNNI